jgi:PTS system nitrogen regulatory IIA component
MDAVISDLQSTGKNDLLMEFAGIIETAYPGARKEQIAESLIERERLASTGFGNGSAIPHAKTSDLNTICGAFGISRTGISFDAIDGKPVNFFFVLVAPQGAANDHIKALGRVSNLLRNSDFRQRVLEAKTSEEIYSIIIDIDGRG